MDEKLEGNRGIGAFSFLKPGFKFPLDKTADHILNTLSNNNARLRAAQCLPFIIHYDIHKDAQTSPD